MMGKMLTLIFITHHIISNMCHVSVIQPKVVKLCKLHAQRVPKQDLGTKLTFSAGSYSNKLPSAAHILTFLDAAETRFGGFTKLPV